VRLISKARISAPRRAGTFSLLFALPGLPGRRVRGVFAIIRRSNSSQSAERELIAGKLATAPDLVTSSPGYRGACWYQTVDVGNLWQQFFAPRATFFCPLVTKPT